MHFEYFFYGVGGAASLELLKVYEYREKLTAVKYRKLFRSPLFWAVVVGMLVASGFVAWAMHADAEQVAVWQVVATGIAARSLVRELGAAKEAVAPTKLGAPAREPGDEPITLRDILL